MEIIANAVQTVPANQNVYFTDSITSGTYSIQHRASSGLVTLLGNTNQCRARYKVTLKRARHWLVLPIKLTNPLLARC